MIKTWFDVVYVFVGSLREARIPVNTAPADEARSYLYAAKINHILSQRPQDADE